MRFSYPHKFYVLGFVLYFAFCIFGFYSLFVIGKFSFIFSIIYSMVCIIPSFWYYAWFKHYKGNYIVLNESAITIGRNGIETTIDDNQIVTITSINNRNPVWIQDVIVFETVQGNRFSITSDINSFRQLRDLIKENFKNKYVCST